MMACRDSWLIHEFTFRSVEQSIARCDLVGFGRKDMGICNVSKSVGGVYDL
jgi:hypothetical protein